MLRMNHDTTVWLLDPTLSLLTVVTESSEVERYGLSGRIPCHVFCEDLAARGFVLCPTLPTSDTAYGGG